MLSGSRGRFHKKPPAPAGLPWLRSPISRYTMILTLEKDSLSWGFPNPTRTPQRTLISSRSASYRGKMQVASTFIVPKNLEFWEFQRISLNEVDFNFKGQP